MTLLLPSRRQWCRWSLTGANDNRPNRNAWFLALGMVASSCYGGTEGDNPFVGSAHPSPCKNKEEFTSYEPMFARPALTLRELEGSGGDFASIGSSLVVARDEMPVNIECLEWQYTDGQLSLMVSNFNGPCGAQWTSSTSVDSPGKLTIALTTCVVAACGSCIYDTSAQVSAPLTQLLDVEGETLEVALRQGDCEGRISSDEVWQVPLSEQTAGIICQPAKPSFGGPPTSDYFSETQRNLYASCDPSYVHAVECTEGRSCVEGYCMAPCTQDTDCPLTDVFVCSDGSCRLTQ